MMGVEYFGARTIGEGRKEGLLADIGQGRHHFVPRRSAAQLEKSGFRRTELSRAARNWSISSWEIVG